MSKLTYGKIERGRTLHNRQPFCISFVKSTRKDCQGVSLGGDQVAMIVRHYVSNEMSHVTVQVGQEARVVAVFAALATSRAYQARNRLHEESGALGPVPSLPSLGARGAVKAAKAFIASRVQGGAGR